MRRLLLLTVLALAACDTAEERAEHHHQRALELLAEGDVERARIEFRNVFRLNDGNVAARLDYARLLRARGETRQAIGQYLRLVEHDPGNIAGHRDLTELALETGDLETAGIHAGRAFALAPGNPETRALKAAIDYREGADRAAAVAMAEEVIAEAPELVAAQMVVIADRLAANRPGEALARIDAARAALPGDEALHLARLAVLEVLGDTAAVGAELQRLTEMFPDNPGAREALVRWHLAEGDPDAAEAVLRATAAGSDDPAPALQVVQFLYEIRGPEAARAELEARSAAAADPRPFRRALAELDFAEGRADAAIAGLEALVADAEPSDATRELQVTLAWMLAETGRAGESAALVEAVLAADRAHVAALKLRARAAIEAGRPEAAIRDLRTALVQAPRDPEIMTIMAQAHEREGSRTLMGEQLARAVEASDQGAAESLRYAAFLIQEDRLGPAEGVIVDALRRAPANRDLLDMLGRIHLAREDWTRVGQVAELLRSSGDPAAAASAAALDARRLAGQGRSEEMLALLEAQAGDGDAGALAGLVRAEVAAGEIDAAAARIEAVLAADPDNRPARLLEAGLHAIRGETAAAEAAYRELIATAPEDARPYRTLSALLASTGRHAEALAVLEAGIAAAGDSELLFAKAGLLEAQGDIPGAIAVYEELYARSSAAPVVANNLASLLTASGAEVDALERAFAIARRLRGTEVPEFQDTYGWILHLRGASAEALDYLVPAAEALPDNAQVQFHRAEAEFALGRFEAAQASFARALATAEAGSPLPQAATARDRLAAMAAPAVH